MMTHVPIVFVDVETTGLSARDGRVIELGMVRVENGSITATYNQLLDPGMDVSWQTTRITGIRNDDVFGKPQFRAVIDEIENFLQGALFAAHNVDFDYGFMKEEFARNGARLSMDRFCTAMLSRKLYPEHRSHALDRIIERHGYSVKSRHRALDDAMVITQFFNEHTERDFDRTFKIITKIMRRSLLKKPHTSYIPFV